MGDPSGEYWEIQEDPSPQENTGKVRWILNKGLGIGKKILVTGVIISSAPLVLPPLVALVLLPLVALVLLPLVAISAIAFACWVPSGVVLASYACSEKLMSKLLPYSTTPPLNLLEHETILMSNNEEEEEEEEVEEKNEEQWTWVGGKIDDIQKEEGGDRGDILEEGVEMTIEFFVKENDEIDEEGKVLEGDEYGEEGVEKNAQDQVIKEVVDINYVEGNGFEGDVGECFELEEKLILENINHGVKTEGLSENYKVPDESPVSEVYGLVSNLIEGDEEIGVTPIEVTTVVMEESGGQERVSDFAEEELVKETRGLLEKIRDESNADNAVVVDMQYVEEIEEGEEEIDKLIGGNIEEMERPAEDNIADADVGLGKPTCTMESGFEEVLKESEETHEMKYLKDANTISEDVTTVVMEESSGQEEDELVKKTRGLLEKIRDADNEMEMDKQHVEKVEGGKEERDQQIGGNAEEIETPVEDKIVDADVGLQEPAGTTEAGTEEIPKESEETHEMKYVKDANTVSEDVKPTEEIGSVLESKNADNNVDAEKPIGETKNVNNYLVTETRINLVVGNGIMEDNQKRLINKESIMQGGEAEDYTNEVTFQLIREKENVVVSNGDAREIADESGINLFDEKNVSTQQHWHAVYEASEGHVGGEGTGFEELPVSRSAHESTKSGISSGKDFTMHSDGVLYNEDNIREKIDAMRSIVGYKGTPHATCIEELKALYIFTGVEPPASFNDSPDLAQVNDKLRFLMSIIGLK